MNHVMIRRIALMGAAISFGVLASLLTVTCMLWNLRQSQIMTTDRVLSASTTPVTVETLPCSISCTPLVVECLAVYDGPFFEDGNPREVFNVAALQVKNTGNTMIPYTSITVKTRQKKYEFEGYLLLPGTTVLIPEKNATELTDKQIMHCSGWTTVGRQREQYGLCLTQMLDGSIQIANRSNQEYHGIIMYYKTYLRDSEIYVGGKPFEAHIPYVSAGGKVNFLPDYYAPGYSAVLCWEIGMLSGI